MKLIAVIVPPAADVARNTIANSGELGLKTAITSCFFTPRRTNPLVAFLHMRSSCEYVNCLSLIPSIYHNENEICDQRFITYGPLKLHLPDTLSDAVLQAQSR